jgi:deoxyribodipyrimidine photo-lyase
VICLYVLDQTGSTRSLGGAARWWLAQSLRELQRSLQAIGSDLVLRQGPAARVIAGLASEVGAQAVYWNEIAQAAPQALADQVAVALKRTGLCSRTFPGDLLVEPSTLRNQQGRGLRVFTPFWRRLLALGEPSSPLPAPQKLMPFRALASEPVEAFQLEPTQPDWADGLRETWKAGQNSAQSRLRTFLSTAIQGYSGLRDRPDLFATSRLSPHLRFGEISPRQVWHAARFVAAERPSLARDVEKFLSELGWREFCRHLLFDHPNIATRNLQASFDRFPWRQDEMELRAWQRGRTGYPIVDAGMRELWRTGVMHNRVRMIAASFLVKHVLIDWREGEKWFWDTLVDADPGSNPANWQWVAGSGADAAPYFRIFNPILQAEKFDPDGAYVRRWIPEIAKLPPPLIYRPWTARQLELMAAGVELGVTYPKPMVDHKLARERALAAYERMRVHAPE